MTHHCDCCNDPQCATLCVPVLPFLSCIIIVAWIANGFPLYQHYSHQESVLPSGANVVFASTEVNYDYPIHSHLLAKNYRQVNLTLTFTYNKIPRSFFPEEFNLFIDEQVTTSLFHRIFSDENEVSPTLDWSIRHILAKYQTHNRPAILNFTNYTYKLLSYEIVESQSDDFNPLFIISITLISICIVSTIILCGIEFFKRRQYQSF